MEWENRDDLWRLNKMEDLCNSKLKSLRAYNDLMGGSNANIDRIHLLWMEFINQMLFIINKEEEEGDNQ